MLDATDKNILLLASYVACKNDLRLYLYRSGKLYDWQKLVLNNHSEILPDLYCLTGCNTVSGLFGHSKTAIFDCWWRNLTLLEPLKDLGSSLEISLRLLASLELLVRKINYNDIASTSPQEAIMKNWNTQKKSSERLPPDPETLRYHCLHANFQCYMLESYRSEEGPPSLTPEWKRGSDGTFQPIMFTEKAMFGHALYLKL